MQETGLCEFTGKVIDRQLDTPPRPDWLDVCGFGTVGGYFMKTLYKMCKNVYRQSILYIFDDGGVMNFLSKH